MKNILITGSTSGIGQLTAHRFAKEGQRVYVHGRSKEKVEALVSELQSTYHNTNIEGFVADLSDLENVKNLGKEVVSKVESIDVLINNAGIFKSPISTTKQGYDIRLAVNYFAPFLLTEALLPLLKKSEAPRIINLSSAAQAPVSETVLDGKAEVSVNEAYGQSKLALTMWSFHLAQQEPNINSIAVNPGSLLNTKMALEAYGQHWSPAEKGSNILYDLSMSEEYLRASGQYFDNDKGEEKGTFAEAHPDAYDATKIHKLIDFTTQLLK